MLRRPSTSDPEIERRAAVGTFAVFDELVPDSALLVGRPRQRRRELNILRRHPAPAFDTPCSLDSRDRRNETRAGEVVRRRERLAVHVIRRLFGHGRHPERAANDDASKRTRLSPELPCHHGPVIHDRRLVLRKTGICERRFGSRQGP